MIMGLIQNAELRMQNGKQLSFLDVGTGSGIIAITIAKQLRIKDYGFQITASDISSAALKVARQNAKMHKVKIKFIKSDLLKNIKGNFDIVIANLPYGWYGVKNRFSSVKDGLKYEPQNALYTGEKGLMIIRRLLNQIAQRKNKPELVYLEFDPRQKQDLSALIKRTLPGSKTKFYKDYNNFWRYVEISL
jgi:release factor glutamine methyltransferase